MSLLTFDNPSFRWYAIAATIMIVKMMSQAWITVFRMLKVNGGFRYPEDAQKGPANPDPRPGQLLFNEYVERSRRMQQNDTENIPVFLAAGLIYVCTAPGQLMAAGLFSAYVLSRLVHFYVILTARSHELRAACWTIGSAIIFVMAGAIIWNLLT
ncbi:MAG TPA: MAPEG family protein [Xanthobacteraceae bacterium]|jgi:glutathione S-transferase